MLSFENKSKTIALIRRIKAFNLLILIAFLKHMGLLALLCIIYFILNIIKDLYLAILKKDEINLKVIKSLFFILFSVALILFHYSYQEREKLMANKMVDFVYEYKKEHNSFPQSLDTIGESIANLARKNGVVYYYDKESPAITSAGLFSALISRYTFYFDKNRWDYSIGLTIFTDEKNTPASW